MHASHTPVVAVTGATGFIGTNLLRRLLQDGVPVRVLARATSPALSRLGDAVTTVEGDVRDTDAVRQVVRGAVTVYHVAGLAKPWARSETEYRDVNVTGTANVCAAAREHGARVVHVSTALLEPATNGTPDQYRHTAYQRTKRAAEDVIREHVEQGGEAVVVRPTRVFGPGPLTASNSVTRMIALYRLGLFRFRIADGDARANYVYVDDVVQGLLLAARGHTGDVYPLGGENVTMPALLDTLADVVGAARTVWQVPPPLARRVARVSEVGTMFGLQPLITREWVDLLTVDWPVSSDHTARVLGYAPRPLRDGLAETVAWLGAGRPERILAERARP